MSLLILLLTLIPPAPASRIVKALTGTDVDLVAICERESACQPIGVHPEDAWASTHMRRAAMRVGWLKPWCPFTRRRAGWGPRGAHGQSAAYSLHFLGPCLPPELLDVPLLSAIAAVRRAESDRCDDVQRCRSWRSA